MISLAVGSGGVGVGARWWSSATRLCGLGCVVLLVS